MRVCVCVCGRPKGISIRRDICVKVCVCVCVCVCGRPKGISIRRDICVKVCACVCVVGLKVYLSVGIIV